MNLFQLKRHLKPKTQTDSPKEKCEHGFPTESTKRQANTEHNKQKQSKNPKKGKTNHGCEGQIEDSSPFSTLGFPTSQWRLFILEARAFWRYQQS